MWKNLKRNGWDWSRTWDDGKFITQDKRRDNKRIQAMQERYGKFIFITRMYKLILENTKLYLFVLENGCWNTLSRFQLYGNTGSKCVFLSFYFVV